MSTLEELTEPATAEEMRDAIYAAIAAAGITTTSWKPGATVRTIVAGLAVVLAAFSRLQAEIAKSGFLELSEGAWLTLVARYVYGVERDEGSFATGIVEVDNASGNVYTGDPGDLVFRNSTKDKTYRNTEAFSIPASSTGTAIAVQADEIGTGSDALAGEIDELVTVLLGVTCSNPEAVLGRDEELDPALRTRCYEKLGTLSPLGPRDAYSFVAKSARRADGTAIGVTRVRIFADGEGHIDVYVAGASGALADPDDVTAVDEEIQQLVTPLGVTASTTNATNLPIAIEYEFWLLDTTGKSNAEIQAIVDAALATFITAQPIGGVSIPPTSGRIYHNAIEAVISGAFPNHQVNVEVTEPAGDVTVGAFEVPTLGAITATINQVAEGLI